MTLDTLKQLLEVGWPALVTVGFAYISLRYLQETRETIAYLRAKIEKLEARLLELEVKTFGENH